MKTAETKSTHSQQHNSTNTQQPFFNKEQEGAFFSEQSSEYKPFFPGADTSSFIQPKYASGDKPFFQPATVPLIQAKCAACEAEEGEQQKEQSAAETLNVQRIPAFDSEADENVQRQPIPGSIPLMVRRMPAFESEADDNVQTEPLIQRQTETETEPGEDNSIETDLQLKLASNAVDPPEDVGESSENGLPFTQAKLTIGKPNDRYEQEADAVADRVVAMPNKVSNLTPDLQAKPLSKTITKLAQRQVGSVQPKRLQRLSKVQKQGDGRLKASSDVASRLNSSQGRGSNLDENTQSEMESNFGADFGNVRVHTGSEAAQLSQDLGAKAFTHGSDIYFNQGQYNPNSSEGKHLLAHELTHTVQQGQAVQRDAETPPSEQSDKTPPTIQKTPVAVGNEPTVSSEVVDVSSKLFKPSEKVKGEIEAQRGKGLDVRTKIKGVTAEGRVKVRLDRQGNYVSIGKGSMPLLNDWTKQLGGMYVNYGVKNNEITKGYTSLKPKGENTNDWLKAIKKNTAALGGLGLKVGSLPNPVNKLENGKVILGAKDLNVEVGGFVDAKFNLLLENTKKPTIDATANINVKGLAKGVLKLDNTKEQLTGEVKLGIDLKAFSGEATVKYKKDGTVDIGGKAAYNANKLSGEIEFVATDLETANRFAKDAIAAAGGKEKVQDAPPPAPVPAAKQGSKQRALAATGQLGFNLTTWFAGTVNVVVDARGNVTAIGRINPPAEIELFPQRNWEKEIITLEARAYYGVPLVGNLNVFANIGLYALAKLGPAKIYNIEVLGTYSTDPDIQRSIQISGSLNISAYAGLRLRAEGGAGIELLAHDLRFGVGLNADVGVKAYADARPTIGYRDPGVFFFSGTLEMVAMPMLGLGGDFFIELDSPWFSPAPDEKWTWPLFSKEWPLSDPIGLNAVLKDYELGSGKVPEVEFKKPEFDPSKFMTNMVDDKLPSKSGGKAKGQSTFKEDASAPKPVVAPKKPAPKQTGTKPSRKGSQPPLGKSAKPDPKAAKAEKSMKLLADASKKTASLKAKAPFTKTDLTKELTKIKGQVRGVDFSVKPKDEKWAITPKAGGKTGRKFELGKKGSVTDGKFTEKDRKLGLAAFEKEEKKYLKRNTISKKNAQKVAKVVKRKHPVFKSINVINGKDSWDYNYIFRAKEDTDSKKDPLEIVRDRYPDSPITPQQLADIFVNECKLTSKQTRANYVNSWLESGDIYSNRTHSRDRSQQYSILEENLPPRNATQTGSQKTNDAKLKDYQTILTNADVPKAQWPTNPPRATDAALKTYRDQLRIKVVAKFPKDIKGLNRKVLKNIKHPYIRIKGDIFELWLSENVKGIEYPRSIAFLLDNPDDNAKYADLTYDGNVLVEAKAYNSTNRPTGKLLTQMRNYFTLLEGGGEALVTKHAGAAPEPVKFEKIRYNFTTSEAKNLWKPILEQELGSRLESAQGPDDFELNDDSAAE